MNEKAATEETETLTEILTKRREKKHMEQTHAYTEHKAESALLPWGKKKKRKKEKNMQMPKFFSCTLHRGQEAPFYPRFPYKTGHTHTLEYNTHLAFCFRLALKRRL